MCPVDISLRTHSPSSRNLQHLGTTGTKCYLRENNYLPQVVEKYKSPLANQISINLELQSLTNHAQLLFQSLHPQNSRSNLSLQHILHSAQAGENDFHFTYQFGR